MAALTVQTIVDAGTKPTFGAASASDTAPIGNGHNIFAVYRNTDSSSKTVGIAFTGVTNYGQPLPQPSLTLAGTTGELWIPLRKDYDNGAGTCTLTTSAQTGVTVAIVQVS